MDPATASPARPRPPRCRAIPTALIALAGALLAALPVRAETLVFGPRDYVRGGTPAVLAAERFPACRPDGGGRLRVENGPDGHPAATLAVVALNRREALVMLGGPGQPPVRERPVALEADNTLLVWFIGPNGATLRVSVGQAAGCLEVALVSPAGEATVSAGLLTVRGTVRGAPEVGVTVNGERAAVGGETFAAHVPVDPSVTELTAVATTADGRTAEARLPITVTPAPEPLVVLRPAPGGGIAPLPVAFTLSSLVPVARVQLDLDGDGVPDFDGPGLEGQVFTYATPGVFLPAVTVTDDAGGTATARAIVQVHDAAALDGLLQGKWAALGAALARGDVDGAAAVFSASSRETYRDQLADLADAGLLGQVAQDLGPLRLVRFLHGAVEYDLRAVRDGVEYSFHVVFVIDEDGVWRLWAF
jgi:hypothetical protein